MQELGTVCLDPALNKLGYIFCSDEYPLDEVGSIADYNVFHGCSS